VKTSGIAVVRTSSCYISRGISRRDCVSDPIDTRQIGAAACERFERAASLAPSYIEPSEGGTCTSNIVVYSRHLRNHRQRQRRPERPPVCFVQLLTTIGFLGVRRLLPRLNIHSVVPAAAAVKMVPGPATTVLLLLAGAVGPGAAAAGTPLGKLIRRGDFSPGNARPPRQARRCADCGLVAPRSALIVFSAVGSIITVSND